MYVTFEKGYTNKSNILLAEQTIHNLLTFSPCFTPNFPIPYPLCKEGTFALLLCL
jgi:hypothetical protein